MMLIGIDIMITFYKQLSFYNMSQHMLLVSNSFDRKMPFDEKKR